MKQYTYSDLSATDLCQLVQRNTDPGDEIRAATQEIINRVKTAGDAALYSFSEQFDGVSLSALVLEKAELQRLAATIGTDQQQALTQAFLNIKKFHSSQLQSESKVETMPGVVCWRETRPIERVGLYVPGGSAVLPSTFLMLGVPARLAGCSEIVVCSPPAADGKINGSLAFCAGLLGIERIYLSGGAQAIAAMAHGTATVPRVDKIFGPGNQYVTMAKTLIQSATQTAIDLPAGPSEVLIIADESANAAYIAADLLAQAEHGADSQAVLVSTSEAIIRESLIAIQNQLPALPRAAIAAAALENSFIVLADTLEQAMHFSNLYAPEHLLLQTRNCEELSAKVINAGSVFIGSHTPESAGDYASGTNHTLPTSGYARSYSGVSLDSFVKKITFQQISPEGVEQIGPVVTTLAGLEGLQAHKYAMNLRMTTLT